MVSTKFHEKPSKELRMILFKSLHIILFRCVPSVTFTVEMKLKNVCYKFLYLITLT